MSYAGMSPNEVIKADSTQEIQEGMKTQGNVTALCLTAQECYNYTCAGCVVRLRQFTETTGRNLSPFQTAQKSHVVPNRCGSFQTYERVVAAFQLASSVIQNASTK